MKMNAAVLHAYHDMRVEQVEAPAYAEDEVLIRVRACGLCGTDLHIVDGAFAGRWPRAFPFIIGHEWAGEIVAVGSQVKGFKVGDRVVGENHLPCRTCRMCKEGRYNLCEAAGKPGSGHRHFGHVDQGALAEYAARPASLLYAIPEHVSFEEASIINQAAIALHGCRRARIQPGDAVAVLGPGLMGLLSMQMAFVMGASRVIVTGTSRTKRLQLAKELGASETIDVLKEDPIARIRELTGGRGVDAVLECAGTPEALRTGLEVVRRGGTIALTGLMGKQEVSIGTDRMVLDEIDVVGVRSGPNCFQPVIDMVASGRLNARPLVDHVFPLDEVVLALEDFRDRKSGAVREIIQI
ncbi:MAG: alcohol dehydrogenase catalytic domain-containing protein [Deltaproteobacteria bacterium]|nr:alcohol dehydrogenase catalytic domain-containing protein [Deltaproteobacteria bacterium]